MKLSIIIPAYNAEKDIARCVESIISQPFSDYEIIIIDDGSTDNTESVCKTLMERDSRISFSQMPSNQGVSAARNEGIRRAKGDWIMFVDADDFICQEKLTNSIVNVPKETDIVYFDFAILQNGKIKTESMLPVSEGYVSQKNELLKLCSYYCGFGVKNWNFGLGAPWGKMYSKPFLQNNKLRFNCSVKRGEDVLFNLEAISSSKKIFYTHSCLYIYTVSSSSGSLNYQRDANRQAEITFKEFSDLIDKDVSMSFLKKDVASIGLQLSFFAIKNKYLIEKDYKALSAFLKSDVGKNVAFKNLFKYGIKNTVWIILIKFKLYFIFHIYAMRKK